jgi:hypothetical protein
VSAAFVRFVAAPMRKEARRENAMNIQAKVALDKQKHPERFCPAPRCLWKTTKLNHKTQVHEGGGHCPRHRAVKPVSDARDVEAELNLGSESTTAIVSRLRSYRADEYSRNPI